MMCLLLCVLFQFYTLQYYDVRTIIRPRSRDTRTSASSRRAVIRRALLGRSLVYCGHFSRHAPARRKSSQQRRERHNELQRLFFKAEQAQQSPATFSNHVIIIYYIQILYSFCILKTNLYSIYCTYCTFLYCIQYIVLQ